MRLGAGRPRRSCQRRCGRGRRRRQSRTPARGPRRARHGLPAAKPLRLREPPRRRRRRQVRRALSPGRSGLAGAGVRGRALGGLAARLTPDAASRRQSAAPRAMESRTEAQSRREAQEARGRRGPREVGGRRPTRQVGPGRCVSLGSAGRRPACAARGAPRVRGLTFSPLCRLGGRSCFWLVGAPGVPCLTSSGAWSLSGLVRAPVPTRPFTVPVGCPLTVGGVGAARRLVEEGAVGRNAWLVMAPEGRCA